MGRGIRIFFIEEVHPPNNAPNEAIMIVYIDDANTTMMYDAW